MKITRTWLHAIGGAALLMCWQICSATQCTSLFPDALQTHDNLSGITFNCDAVIHNNPDITLNTMGVNNPSGSCANTCSSAACQASGQPADMLDAGNFQLNDGGQDVTVNNNDSETLGGDGVVDYDYINVKTGGTVSFVSQGANTVYRIQRLDLGQDNTANFAPGDYWIEDFDVGQNAVINITGEGTVRLMLSDSTTINQGSSININSGEQNPAKLLFIYAYNDFSLNQVSSEGTVNFNGFIYANGDVVIHQGCSLTGAINAKSIEFKNSVEITYDPIAAAELDAINTCQFVPTITHFTVQHDGQGIYCVPEPVTVTAYNGAMVESNFNGAITLNTGTGKGSWSLVAGNGQLVDAVADDGMATYTFDITDNGQAKFALLYTSGDASMDIDAHLRYNANIRDDDSEGNLDFTPTGFVLTNAAISSPMPENIANYADTQTSAIADVIYITAFGLRGDMSCGLVNSYSGNKTVKFWQSYINPTSGTTTTSVDGITVGTSSAGAIPVSLQFTDGSSSFNAKYDDVGMIQLHALDDSVAEPPEGLRGSTDHYVVRPAKFVVTVPNNPAAADASGNAFTKAGDDFTVEVAVQNNDGNITPNYGNEVAPAGIKIVASSLVAPAGGRNGSTGTGLIGNNSVFSKVSPGVFRGDSFYFDEVGIIRLQAMVADGNYLGAGNVVGPESGNVGRFIPHHFALTANVPVFGPGCNSGGFTYLGQDFQYNVQPQVTATARAKFNTITENYRDAFWKMGSSNIGVNYNHNTTVATLNSTDAQTDVAVSQTGNGVGEIQLGDGGGITFDKVAGAHIAPFNAEISVGVNVQDADGVVYGDNPYVFGDVQPNTGVAFSGNSNLMLQGRMRLENAFGSELQPLTIPVEMQYFNGSDYLVNTADNCTVISDPTTITLMPSVVGLSVTPTFGPFANGVGRINLSAPNQTGDVDLILDISATGASMPYLQHDWPQDGSDGVFNDNPTCRGTFGIYQGDDKVIFRREVLD